MVVTVSIRSADAAVASLSLDSPRIVLGRSRGSDVRIPDASVSARHASIRQRGADYLLLDEGSTNGTYVDGQRLNPGAPVLLKHEAEVRLGRVWLDVRIEQAVPSPNPSQLTREIALALIAGALEADGHSSAPCLQVRSGASRGSQLLLEESEHVYVVGRGDDSDLELVEDDASRRHLEVMRRGGDVLVRDMESKNGTLLDGQRLLPRQATPLDSGQCLTIGATALVLVDPLSDALRQLETGPDEVMSDDERTGRAPVANTDLDETPDPSITQRAETPAPTPAPKRSTRPTAERRGWSTTDWLVAVLAIATLGASAAGMVWLFNT